MFAGLSDMYPFHPWSYSHVVCRHFQGDLLDVYPGLKPWAILFSHFVATGPRRDG
jgi:hypothetical protein